MKRRIALTLAVAAALPDGAAERIAYDAAASTVRLALDSGAVVRLVR